MVPLLINKDVFEPSDDYLKFMNQNHNSFWMSQTHLFAYQPGSTFLPEAQHGAENCPSCGVHGNP